MDHARRIAHRLHEEHLASLEILGRFELALSRAARNPPPGDPAWGSLAGAVCAMLEHELVRHFAFEEQELFPRLAAAGESFIGDLLTEEHEAMREVIATLLPALRAAGPTATAWDTVRRSGFEFVERMQAHIQKEEMGLLPMIEDLIDEDTDEALALAYDG